MSAAAGMVAVAATYVYFLLFAQFGFLALARQELGPAADLGPLLLAMGLCGLAASLVAAALLGTRRAPFVLPLGFAAAFATAALVPRCHSRSALVVLAGCVGLSSGLATVALAAGLAHRLGRHTGLKAGIATGLAYFICNLGGVFDAPPARQCAIGAIAALAGLFATVIPLAAPTPRDAARRAGPTENDVRLPGFLGVVLLFLALIWLDSAAFAIIQNNPPLRSLTWGSPERPWSIGLTHALAGAAAGWLLDLGLFRRLLIAVFVSFVVAFAMLTGSSSWAGPLYAAGISSYSVALVVFPSWNAEARGLIPTRWRAAAIYGVCGWIGSALGLALSQHAASIPGALVACATVTLVAGLALGWRRNLASLARAHVATFGLAGAALGVALLRAPSAAMPESAVERGRLVYIGEGCIHCHSQYVRPGTRDEGWWGPYRPHDPHEAPPLIGNRRQGPDLSNVGLRRSAEWERLHLREPREVASGSTMPSYAYLFPDGRGEDLVAYLTSLGNEDDGGRLAGIREYRPEIPARLGRPDAGRSIFAGQCAPCHGARGRGDGPLGAAFNRETLDLGKEQLWLLRPEPGESDAVALARLIRFGWPGGSMPGHEYFTERELADVTAYVLDLPPGSRTSPSGG